jgi:peroxiredoxin
MRGLILYVLIFLTLLSCTSISDSIIIEGKVSGLENQTVKLLKLDLQTNEPLVVDSISSKNGVFKFIVKKEPSYLHTLIVNDSIKFPFFVDKSNVKIDGDIKSIESFIISSKSKEDNFFRKFSQDDFFDRKIGMDIMINYPDNIVSVFTAYYQFQIHNISQDTMSSIIDNFSSYSKNSIYFDYLKSLYEKITSINEGVIAPNFTSKDIDGKQHSLYDFRGKYVYIDFWASWCAPCIEKFPEMKKIYNSRDKSKFEILGVSVDVSRDSWIKSIEKNKLNWINISNTKGWDEISDSYGVKAVPQNFLVDPDGVILYKNISLIKLRDFFENKIQAQTLNY